MDTIKDSESFRELLDGLSLTLTGFPAKDELAQAYWSALKDVRYSEVKANVERIVRCATKDTRFPRPAELRDTAPTLERYSAAFEAAERASAATWDDLRRRDPIEYQIQLRIAKCARALAATPTDDITYTDWQREYARWNALRYAPRADKERAVDGGVVR